jgi:transcriptional regulator with XRE-family HTH domain
MKRIPVDNLHKKWMKDSAYRREYEALEEEFSLVSALIEARTRAGLTQEQVAHRMKTTQAVIARLEGGGSKPSTRTLERYAEATGSRLRITFEPQGARARRYRNGIPLLPRRANGPVVSAELVNRLDSEG